MKFSKFVLYLGTVHYLRLHKISDFRPPPPFTMFSESLQKTTIFCPPFFYHWLQNGSIFSACGGLLTTEAVKIYQKPPTFCIYPVCSYHMPIVKKTSLYGFPNTYAFKKSIYLYMEYIIVYYCKNKINSQLSLQWRIECFLKM